MSDVPARKRGFALLSPAQRKLIAARGGRRAHANGNARTWTADEARANAQKGGLTVSADREHMAAIGRKGAKRRQERLNETAELPAFEARV